VYWKVWELLPEESKDEARTAMHAAALAARVEGAKESKAVVTERATEMLLGDDGLMAYRLGAPVFPYTFCIDTCQVMSD
jgi:hypothetical protein